MNSDLTFISNEENRNLLERFKVLIKDTQFRVMKDLEEGGLPKQTTKKTLQK